MGQGTGWHWEMWQGASQARRGEPGEAAGALGFTGRGRHPKHWLNGVNKGRGMGVEKEQQNEAKIYGQTSTMKHQSKAPGEANRSGHHVGTARSWLWAGGRRGCCRTGLLRTPRPPRHLPGWEEATATELAPHTHMRTGG